MSAFFAKASIKLANVRIKKLSALVTDSFFFKEHIRFFQMIYNGHSDPTPLNPLGLCPKLQFVYAYRNSFPVH